MILVVSVLRPALKVLVQWLVYGKWGVLNLFQLHQVRPRILEADRHQLRQE